MSLTLDLPLPINEELSQDSQRDGISEMEHAALLVCLASAFKQDEAHTPFQKAVRVFLSHHSLDAERVFSVFEELVRVCLDAHDAGKLEASFGKGKTTAALQLALLSHWRNAIVHQPVDASYDALASEIPPLDIIVQSQGQTNRAKVSEMEARDPRDQVRALLTQWQSEDSTPPRSPIPTKPGETPTQALFRKWAEEDAHMTEEEKEAEDLLWEDIEKGIKENHLALGTRQPAS